MLGEAIKCSRVPNEVLFYHSRTVFYTLLFKNRSFSKQKFLSGDR